MTWLKTDDRYPDHRKIRRLSDGAYRLHHGAQCYAAHDETDGVIRTDDIADIQHGKRLSKHIPALVEAGLWEPILGGWLLHDFLDYNPSHVQMEAERAAARERQARARAKRRGVTGGPAEPESHAVTNAVTNGDVTRESHHESRAPVPGRSVPGRSVPFRAVPATTPEPHLGLLRDGDQDQIVAQVTRDTPTLGLGANL